MRGDIDFAPVKVGEEVARSKDILKLFEKYAVIGTVEVLSPGFICRPFRKFLLYLDIDSTGTPTDLRIKVQFLNRVTGRWHTYKQGLFASFYYEDVDTASGIWECFSGENLGREMRITLTGTGTSGSAYFTVSAYVEFMN